MFHFPKLSSLRAKRGNPDIVIPAKAGIYRDSSLETITLKLSGLHCTSCALNIDLTLEGLPGVKNSSTNYAKSEAKITFDPSKTNLNQIKSTITDLGYTIV